MRIAPTDSDTWRWRRLENGGGGCEFFFFIFFIFVFFRAFEQQNGRKKNRVLSLVNEPKEIREFLLFYIFLLLFLFLFWLVFVEKTPVE